MAAPIITIIIIIIIIIESGSAYISETGRHRRL